MRIKLISPDVKTNFSGWIKKLFILPRLSLPVIAAATPEEHVVTIEDESFDKIDFEEPVDIVGISTITAGANRAYEIADTFRKKGTKVLLGGMHPSVLPTEALEHADSVVVGEAELVWPQILEDIEQGKLKRIYSNPLSNLNNYKFPRRNLIKKKGFSLNTIEASRGCPNSCDFCSVIKLHKSPKYKTRNIENIVREVEELNSSYMFFVDDNLVGNKRFSKELFKELTPYKLKWISQLSIDVANDRELLDVFSKSGLVGAYIGFDSVVQSNLNESKKRLANYMEAVKIIRDKGIGIQGSFIFGFENDDISVFDATLEFLEKTKLELAYFHILTPYPGTALFERMKEHIFTFDWDKYDSKNVVFYHPKMEPEVLYENYLRVWNEFYSSKSIRRILRSNHKLYSALTNITHMFKKKHIGTALEYDNAKEMALEHIIRKDNEYGRKENLFTFK